MVTPVEQVGSEDMSGRSKGGPRAVYRKEYSSVEMDCESRWRSIFNKYDEDHDGEIPLDHLKELMKTQGSEISVDLPPFVLDEVVESADRDKNGKLSYEEFKQMIRADEIRAARPRLHQCIKYAAMTVCPANQRKTVIRKYLDEYNCMPPPLFLPLVSIVELGVFIYYCVKIQEISATGPVPIDSPLIYNPHKRYEAWRFLTYMLIHAGGVHIFFNLLMQFMIGIPLEMVHKWWRVTLVYIGGVVAGSLGSSLSDPNTFLAGASGGVYALIAAHLASVILNFKEMDFRWLRLGILLVFVATDVGVAVYGRYTEEKNNVSYAAHIAGALGGLLIGVNVLRNLVVHKWETITGWVLLLVFSGLMLFAIFWNAFNPSYFPKQT